MTEEQSLPSWVTSGNLDDVNEEKPLLPSERDVLVKVKDIDINSEDRDGNERTWKFLTPTYEIVDGIEIKGELKYKGSLIFNSTMICYYADYEVYKTKSPNYAEGIYKGQHLVDLKKFCKACSIEGVKISSVNGLTDAEAAMIAEKSKGKKILLTIGQRIDKKTQLPEQTIGNFKKVNLEDTV